MKAGVVTSIRINPRDAQSVLDVLDAAGLPRGSLSFAQCTSLALGSLLETARQTNLIPEPDEFQYLNRLSPYLGPTKQKRKVKMANVLHDMGGKMRAPALSEAPLAAGSVRGLDHASEASAKPTRPQVAAEPVDSKAFKLAQGRLTHLIVLKEQLEDEGKDLSPTDQAEYDRCYSIVYPNG